MDKQEVHQLVKSKLKPLGFKKRGNYYYKIINDNYWAGIYLDHHPYCKGYFFEYGGKYLPNSSWKTPYFPPFDWDNRFLFTITPEDDLSLFIHDPDCYSNLWHPDSKLIDYFEYDVRTLDELERSFDINYSVMFEPLMDENYILNEYRKDWTLFRTVHVNIAEKIAQLAGLDLKTVLEFRNNIGDVKWF